MKKFEFVDITTSDVAFISYGRNLNELFENSALAMFEVMVDTKNVKPVVSRKVSVKGNDMQSLMFSWLNSLLLYVDSESLVFSKFIAEVDGEKFFLRAECFGEKINPKRHELKTSVKSPTYHKMEIKKEKGFWKARVILDI
ncbi:MAG: archease [Candidatus Aenigmatarchaeota archaeon]